VPLVDDAVEASDELAAELQERYLATASGMLVEQSGQRQPVWACPVSEFELWLGALEGMLDMPLGRRLAHAAAESEEWRMQAADRKPPNPLFGKEKKRLVWLNEDWHQRGMGEISLLESEPGEVSLVVRRRPHPALAAGITCAAWERIQKRRYRFRWTDGGSGESLITLEPDRREIPSSAAMSPSWDEVPASTTVATGPHPFLLSYNEGGDWTVDGVRMLALARDLLLRFEDVVLPHLADKERSSDPRVGWTGVDDRDRLLFWDALAEVGRVKFVATGEMVLVAAPTDWVDVGRRFLSTSGMGTITTAESLDDMGGVRLTADNLFHPALAIGILLGAWERAEARPAGAAWTSSEHGHTIELTSLRDIA